MPDPLYRTIADDLRKKIESGKLPPGHRLPGEEELRKQYAEVSSKEQPSRNTIRKALEWLVGRGLVETRTGQGTFVFDEVNPFVTTLSPDFQTEAGLSGGEGNAAFKEAFDRKKTPVASQPEVSLKFALGTVARLLKVPERTGLIVRQQKRSLDGTPWSIQTSYYPVKYTEGGKAPLLSEPADIEDGAVNYIKKELGIVQIGYRDHVVVRAPDDEEARFFKLPDSGLKPVVVIYRTGFVAGQEDREGPTPFRLTVTVFPADRNQFVINAGAVDGRLADPI